MLGSKDRVQNAKSTPPKLMRNVFDTVKGELEIRSQQ